jgi:BMFP domain-containing protein YqiC
MAKMQDMFINIKVDKREFNTVLKKVRKEKKELLRRIKTLEKRVDVLESHNRTKPQQAEPRECRDEAGKILHITGSRT